MKIFLSGKYERRSELAAYAEQLKAQGHEITSSWLDGTHEAKDRDHTDAEAEQWAIQDLKDIDDCDIFVIFTCGEGSERGGRHFEAGYAHARNKLMMAIGPKEENIFYRLIPCLKTFEEFLADKTNE